MSLKFYLCCVLLLGVCCYTQAHDDLHEQIKKATEAIKDSPKNPSLFLHRGGLYSQHEEYKKALKDFKKCRKLNYLNHELYHKEATVFYKLNKFSKALNLLNKILESDDQNVAALRLKGQVFLKDEQFENAALAFEQLISKTNKTIPENYFEAAYAWEQTNTKTGYRKSVKILKEGIHTLGPLLTFHKRLIELNRAQENYEEVLYYQDEIITQSNRKERAYLERAKTYITLNNLQAAKVDLLAAKKAFDQLNSRLKSQTANKELLEAIQNELQKIDSQ